MDWHSPTLWLDVAQSVVLVVLWLRKPGTDAKEAVGLLRDVVGALNGRVDVLQERMGHMPTNQELSDLAGTVKAIERECEGQSGRLDSMQQQLGRIEQFLLTHRAP